MASFFSDGGPGPAHRLLRVDDPDPLQPSVLDRFLNAQAWEWDETDDTWVKYPGAQSRILQTGEFTAISEDAVDQAKADVRQFALDAPRLARIARGLET